MATLATLGCGKRSTLRVDTQFTPAAVSVPGRCPGDVETLQVPVVPIADLVLGDIIVRCGGDCDEAKAAQAVVGEAHKLGAAHVSHVTCVHHDEDWSCVGRLSSPGQCSEDS